MLRAKATRPPESRALSIFHLQRTLSTQLSHSAFLALGAFLKTAIKCHGNILKGKKTKTNKILSFFNKIAQNRDRMEIKGFLYESARQLAWDHPTMQMWKAKGIPDVINPSLTGQVWHFLPTPYPQPKKWLYISSFVLLFKYLFTLFGCSRS